MPGIMPDATAGGVVIRDPSGVPTSPPGVLNAYVPPATFVASCALTALPSDCSGRWTPAQLNALVSEILALAVALSPSGTWNCTSSTNLASLWTAWVTGGGLASAAANGICASPSAKDTLADCLVSPAAGNALTSDGNGLFVDAAAPVCSIPTASRDCALDTFGFQNQSAGCRRVRVQDVLERAAAIRAATQSYPDNVETDIVFDSSQVNTCYGNWSPTGTFTFTRAGSYFVGLLLFANVTATGGANIFLQGVIRLNGALVVTDREFMTPSFTATYLMAINTTFAINAAVGDVLRFSVLSTSGSPGTILANSRAVILG